MLSGIKDKILNVKKNVGLFVGDDKAEKSAENPKINHNAGARILQHFQDQWVEIHNLNEENSKAAEHAANEIENASKKVSTSKDNLGVLTHIITNSNLTTNISLCLNKVKELYDVCEQVQEGLVQLQNLIDEVEFENMKKQHRCHLESYKARKLEAMENLKASLEEEHKRKVEKHEASKKSILEERQKVFQEAFKTDIEIYKSLGTIPKVDLPKHQNGAILEEIQLDYDQSELDHFFNDT